MRSGERGVGSEEWGAGSEEREEWGAWSGERGFSYHLGETVLDGVASFL